MIPLLLLLALCPSAGLGDGTPPAADAENVYRTYDLAAYGGLGVRDESQQVVFPGTLQASYRNSALTPVWAFSPDLLIELTTSLLSEELEYEGRHYSVTADDHMQMRAPQEVQNQALAILGALGESSRSTARLRVDVLNLVDGALQIPVGIVDTSRVSKYLALETATPIQSYSLALRASIASRVHDSRTTSFVGDYDVEVATSATGFDPIIIQMQTGTRMFVRTSPARGGCDLALTYWSGTSARGVTDQRFDSTSFIATDSGTERVPGPDILQSMSVNQRTLALNTMIPTGKALVLLTKSVTGSGGSTQLVILRLEGKLQPPIRSTRIAEDMQVHVIRDDAISPVRLGISGIALDVLGHQGLLSDWLRSGEGVLTCKAIPGDEDYLVQVLQDSLPDMEFNYGEAWIVAFREGGPEQGDKDKLAALIDALQPTSDVLQVSFVLDRGGPGGERAVACELPLRVGTESAFVVGNEFTTVGDTDVEIAQGAVIHDPTSRLDLDGVIFAVTPRRMANGQIQLRIRGGAQVLSSSSQIQARDQSFDALELPTFDRLLVNETLYFDGSAGDTAVIGNSAEELAEGSMRLTVQVR